MKKRHAISISIITAAMVSALVVAQPSPSPGLQKVIHDSTLKGSGTNPAPLGLALCGSGQTWVMNGSATGWGCGSGGGGGGGGSGNVTTAGLTSGRSVRATSGSAISTGAWTDDGTNASANGTTTVQQLIDTVITPTAISGTVNDWAPTGASTATTIVIAGSGGATTLTGLAGGVNGRRVTLIWTATADNLTIPYGSTSSSAANRIVNFTGVSLILGPAGLGSGLGLSSNVTLEYSTFGGNGRWRVVAINSPFMPGYFFTSDVDLGTNQIHSVVDPSSAQDVATKNYVDAHGGITSVACGTGLSCSPSPIVSTGTVALANTAVTPGFYSYASFTVDAQGRLTSASPGVGPISPSLSITVNAFPGSTVNLSTVGTVDWYWYGNTGSPSVGGGGGGADWNNSNSVALHWKKGGELFRNFVWIGHGLNSSSGAFPGTTTFTSTTSDDSFGVALSATDGTYDVMTGAGVGYQFSAAAGTTARTLRLYTGAKGVVTTITASFDDASVTTATATFSAASGVHELRAVDIAFQASSGTRLRVTVLATTLNGGVQDEDFYGAAEF